MSRPVPLRTAQSREGPACQAHLWKDQSSRHSETGSTAEAGEALEMSTPPEQSLGDDLRAWAERLVEPNLRPGESLQDFMAGAIHLAEKRARLHGRSRSTSLDLLFQLLCWDLCRFFPPSRGKFEEKLGRIRQDVFAGAATGNFERLEARARLYAVAPDRDAIYGPGEQRHRRISTSSVG